MPPRDQQEQQQQSGSAAGNAGQPAASAPLRLAPDREAGASQRQEGTLRRLGATAASNIVPRTNQARQGRGKPEERMLAQQVEEPEAGPGPGPSGGRAGPPLPTRSKALPFLSEAAAAKCERLQKPAGLVLSSAWLLNAALALSGPIHAPLWLPVTLGGSLVQLRRAVLIAPGWFNGRRRGDTVLITARNTEGVREAVAALREEVGPTAGQIAGERIACDVSSPAGVERLAAEALDRLGRVDVWLNNAGDSGGFRALVDQPAEVVERVVRTTLVGALLCSRAALAIMRHQPGGGHIFAFMGAGGDGRGTPKYLAYGASKAALSQALATLRQEAAALGPHPVAVHSLQPGMVLTGLLLEGATPLNKQLFNIVAEHPETVAAYLVPRVRTVVARGQKGADIRFLTLGRAALRLLTAPFRRVRCPAAFNRFFDREGRVLYPPERERVMAGRLPAAPRSRRLAVVYRCQSPQMQAVGGARQGGESNASRRGEEGAPRSGQQLLFRISQSYCRSLARLLSFGHATMWRQKLDSLTDGASRLRKTLDQVLVPGIPGELPPGAGPSRPPSAAGSAPASPDKAFVQLPVLRNKGLTNAQLDDEVRQLIDHADVLRQQEEALGSVMVISAQAEIERLREQLDFAATELTHARRQLDVAAAAARAQHVAAGEGPGAAGAAAGSVATPPAPERVELQLRWPVDGSGRVGVQLVPAGANAAAVLAELLEALGTQQAAAAGEQGAGSGPSPQLLQRAAATLAQLALGQGVELALPGGSAQPQAAGGKGDGGEVASLKARCAELEWDLGKLQGELSQAQSELAFARNTAEQRAQEQRTRVTAAHQQASELLRVAQDGRLAAEERCAVAERRLAQAEERAAKLDSDLQDAQAEAKRTGQETRRAQTDAAAAEARAAQAEAALQRERTLGSRAAELDTRSAEVLAQQRSRLAELEAASQQAARQLAAAQHRSEAAERRAVAAEAAAAHAAAEATEHEAVTVERDELAARLAVLEGRLDETRAERAQVEAFRELAETAEARRARAEDELVSTARLAAELEARLAEVTQEAEGLRLDAQAARAAARAAEQSVEAAVHERWAAAGRDRAAWPLAAQEEMENVEARLAAMHAALKAAEQRAADEAVARQADAAARQAAEVTAAAAEDTCSRTLREARQREQRLEAAASAATAQVSEFRKALVALERERDELLVDKRQWEAAHVAAAQAVAAARCRTGSGALPEPGGGAGGPPAGGGRSPSISEETKVLPPPGLLSPRRPMPEQLDTTELLFLKNVLLKFLDAQINGRFQECEVLLPAVATLLRATPREFHVLRSDLARAQSWLPSLPGLPSLPALASGH
eukprot:scaffold20.g7841.t1